MDSLYKFLDCSSIYIMKMPPICTKKNYPSFELKTFLKCSNTNHLSLSLFTLLSKFYKEKAWFFCFFLTVVSNVYCVHRSLIYRRKFKLTKKLDLICHVWQCTCIMIASCIVLFTMTFTVKLYALVSCLENYLVQRTSWSVHLFLFWVLLFLDIFCPVQWSHSIDLSNFMFIFAFLKNKGFQFLGIYPGLENPCCKPMCGTLIKKIERVVWKIHVAGVRKIGRHAKGFVGGTMCILKDKLKKICFSDWSCVCTNHYLKLIFSFNWRTYESCWEIK